MNTAQILTRSAALYPDSPAVSVGLKPVWTYRAFAEAVARLAGGLRASGLVPGDRVGIAMSNCPEFLQAMFAAWHAGLIIVPMNPRLHRQEFAYILKHCEARLCFASPDLADTLAGLEAEIAPLERLVSSSDAAFAELASADPIPLSETATEAPAWIFYTSGTTGRPKGATLSHRNLAFMAQAYFADIDTVEAGHTMLHAAALSHGSGLYGLPHIAHGGHQVITASSSFDTAEIAELIAHYPEVSFFAAPTMLARLVTHLEAHRSDTANLRTIVYGGGPAYVADLQRALAVLGPKLAQIYGQGETPMTIASLSRQDHFVDGRIADASVLSTCGVPRTFVEVRCVDEDGRDVAAGEIGEIVTRSDCVMSGYWNAPEATAAALKDGWLHTGDLGSFDAAGRLSIKDRSKDMIISGASNIYPREIEEVLLTHPDVAEISVVGRPHPDWVEEVVAVVVARPGRSVDAAELDRLCVDNIARYKRPRAYLFADHLPKNTYGKVLKTELREWARRAAEAGTTKAGAA